MMEIWEKSIKPTLFDYGDDTTITATTTGDWIFQGPEIKAAAGAHPNLSSRPSRSGEEDRPTPHTSPTRSCAEVQARQTPNLAQVRLQSKSWQIRSFRTVGRSAML
jgi:hypothetical protein